MTHIQAALDLTEADRALKIAEEAVLGGADWIEAGTPLIKSEGMNVVRRLREKFPDNTILADMKTMDAGAVEVEIAAKSGADIVIILGEADDSVILESLRSARNYGVSVMVDLISVKDPVARAKELEKMGVEYLNVHVGIDQQMTGKSPLETLAKIRSEVGMKIAVAGGLNDKTAAEAVSYGADIVIVGSYIIKSGNVRESAANVRAAIEDPDLRKTVAENRRSEKSREEEMLDIFRSVSSSNISDAMHRGGAMKGISPVLYGKKTVGRAYTAQTLGGDWAKPVEAIDQASPGDVLVIYNGGNPDIAMWGGLATLSAKMRGLAGVVVDGAVRDRGEIEEIDFPVYASNVVPNAGDPKGMGETDTEIRCGGQIVRPGDYIIGDDSGVVVVPKENAYEIARRALEVKKRELRIFDEIRRGSTLSASLEILRWEKKNR